MAICIWRGDAQGIAQEARVTVTNVEEGDTFTLTVNRKDVSFTATAATADNVYAGLAAAINAANIPEFPTAAYVTEDSDSEDPHIHLTGASDGTPFSISGTTTNGGTGTVSVSLIQDGQAGRNMKQRVAIPAGVSGGTFTLTFEGQTTSALTYDESAADIETALKALSNIGASDVSVTGDAGGPWVVEFTGTLAKATQPLLTGNGASLTGQSVSITEIQAGQSGTNYAGYFNVQWDNTFSAGDGIRVYGTDAYGTPRTDDISSVPFNETDWRYAIATALNASTSDVTVTITDESATSIYDNDKKVEFECVGALAGLANMELTAKWIYDLSSITVTETDTGGNTLNEKQLVTLPGNPTGGTFTLTFQGQTTGTIAYNASSATVQTALEALSNVTAGDVIVTDGSVSGWQVEFDVTYGDQDLALMTGSGASLTGGVISVSATQTAVADKNEKVLVTLGDEVTGGTFTLTHATYETGNIAYNATSSAVDTALEALTHLTSGDISVTGNPGGPWTIEFTGNFAATDVGEVTADGDNLTGSSTQGITVTSVVTPTGPYHWDNAENWSGGSVPASSDTAVFEDNANPVKYGLDQSAVTLTLLDIRASYTGEIGLPNVNEDGVTAYIEYREKYLKIGATTVRFGEGEGDGSERIRIDLGSVASTIYVHSTATPPATGTYAVNLKGTNAANDLYVYQGLVAVAQYSGEEGVIDDLYVGFEGDPTSDVELFLGDDVTIDDARIHGGLVTNQGRSGTAIGSVLATAGEVYLNGTDGLDQLDIEGGEVYYRSSGTLGGNTVVGGEGTLNFAGDLRAKTVTNSITVRGDAANVVDSQEVVSSLSVVYQSTTRIPELGTNFTVARS